MLFCRKERFLLGRTNLEKDGANMKIEVKFNGVALFQSTKGSA